MKVTYAFTKAATAVTEGPEPEPEQKTEAAVQQAKESEDKVAVAIIKVAAEKVGLGIILATNSTSSGTVMLSSPRSLATNQVARLSVSSPMVSCTTWVTPK